MARIQMATVKRSPNGKKWRARWYDPSGKECAKDFDLKRDASRHAADMEASKARGQYVDPHDKTTVIGYARQWASGRPHGARTARKLASTLKNHVAATSLGNRRMASVLPSDIQAWATGRSKVLGPLTLQNVVYTVSSIFKAAAADRLIGSSPFVNITLPESHQERLVPLTVAQVRQLADAMPARNRAMVIVQAGLGLRVGELMGLRVEDVRFLKREVRVETQIPPDGTEREDPKTALSKRTLPLPTFVAEALAEHMREFPPAADGSIFWASTGRPYTHTTYMTIFRNAVVRAGLPDGTTSHDLRHHYASVLLMAGESVVAVAERLGHKNANLVIKTYGHLMPDSEERTRSALDNAWRDADQVRTSGSSRAV
jgi:integrase